MNKIVAVLLLLVAQQVEAQIGIGTNTPDSSAALDISDTAKGILIPRMSMRQKNNIQNPAAGLMIYQTDSIPGYRYYNGNEWVGLVTSGNNNLTGGKRTLVISDTITNAQAQAKILSEFGPNTEEIRIIRCTGQGIIDKTTLTSLGNIVSTN